MLTPRKGLLLYEPHGWLSGGTLGFACLELFQVEFRPTRGRPPTVASVKVQLKPVISSHDVGSIHVSFALEGMLSEAEHPVGVLVALDEVLDALEVTVEEPDGRTEELEVCFEVPEATDTEAEVVEDEPEFSAAATVASVDFECTLITFFAMRAPTTAPTIARIARTPATQNPISC